MEGILDTCCTPDGLLTPDPYSISTSTALNETLSSYRQQHTNIESSLRLAVRTNKTSGDSPSTAFSLVTWRINIDETLEGVRARFKEGFVDVVVVRVEDISATADVVSTEVVPDEVSAAAELASAETVPEVVVKPVSIAPEVEVEVAVAMLLVSVAGADEMAVVPCGIQTPASTTAKETSAAEATAINLFETITNLINERINKRTATKPEENNTSQNLRYTTITVKTALDERNCS
ncbi:hypothetical protein CDV31_000064 [Fusarium ambrosium]|uniref:Uncharacterized protein n=1 Tax=Fusarium ambrosium TaxID=131363 RepID=A0A428V3D0_9HYPO|nr:hypothetical protein CDV31_000064 [Fusarium ambrosium]